MRETFSPPRSSTLQRRESVISRGFNALFRDGGYRRMPILREGLQDLLSRGVKSANCFPCSILPLAPCLVLDLATGGATGGQITRFFCSWEKQTMQHGHKWFPREIVIALARGVSCKDNSMPCRYGMSVGMGGRERGYTTVMLSPCKNNGAVDRFEERFSRFAERVRRRFTDALPNNEKK